MTNAIAKRLLSLSTFSLVAIAGAAWAQPVPAPAASTPDPTANVNNMPRATPGKGSASRPMVGHSAASDSTKTNSPLPGDSVRRPDPKTSTPARMPQTAMPGQTPASASTTTNSPLPSDSVRRPDPKPAGASAPMKGASR